MQTPSGQVSPSGASNDPSPDLPNSDSKGDSVTTPDLPLNDLDEENSEDGTYSMGRVEDLLHCPRRSISLFDRIERKQDVEPDSDRRVEKGNASSGKDGESYEDQLNLVDKVPCRASVTNFSTTYTKPPRHSRIQAYFLLPT